MNPPKEILVTLGDPLSVNIECLGKVLSDSALTGSNPFILIGSKKVLDFQLKASSASWRYRMVHPESLRSGKLQPGMYLIDLDKADTPSVEVDPKKMSIMDRGNLARAALETAGELLTVSTDRFSVLTCPIDKNATTKAGFGFPGQTEFFESVAKKPGLMCLAGPKLRVGLVTNHVALRDVAKTLSAELIVRKLELFAAGLQDRFGIAKPKIAVVGLNPHAGDGGIFGDEESLILEPAIQQFQKTNTKVTVIGPIPADTAFYYTCAGKYDGVLAMYHDQGLGPFKTVHFDTGVNATLGLDFLRVSPDHGPAADLYGRGSASDKSFRAAIALLTKK